MALRRRRQALRPGKSRENDGGQFVPVPDVYANEMGDLVKETGTAPAREKRVFGLGAFLALASLVWLAILLLPDLLPSSGFVAAMASAGIALFLAGTAQVLFVRKGGTKRHRRLVLLNGASAVGIPAFALVHNLVAALSGGKIEEPISLLLAAVILPVAVIVTSVVICLGALRS